MVRALMILLRHDDAIIAAKKKVLSKLVADTGYQVKYGLFKGMQLDEAPWWGSYDMNSKLLGVYELSVQQRIESAAGKGDFQFIDIGAADGFFAVGVAFAGIAKSVSAFDIDPKAQEKLKENFLRNGCGHIASIHGEATAVELRNLICQNSKSIVLIDIEGAEYEFLDEEMLYVLKDCLIICELHPWLLEDGTAKELALIERASKNHAVSFLKRQFIDPMKFEELSDFNEDEQLLAISEARGRRMRWMVLEEKINLEREEGLSN